MPATVFLSTEIIETKEPYWWLRLDYAWHHARRPLAGTGLPAEGSELVRGDLESLRRLKSTLRRTPTEARNGIVSAVEDEFESKLTNPSEQYPYAKSILGGCSGACRTRYGRREPYGVSPQPDSPSA